MTENGNQQDNDLVGRLIRAAGHRQPPPSVARESVWAASIEKLRAHVDRRKRRRQAWLVGAALAATILVTFGTVMLRGGPASPAAVATVARLVGEASTRDDERGGWRTLAGQQATLTAGAQLRTGVESRLAMLTAAGYSLRVNELTRLVLEDTGRVRLLYGTVYVDSRGVKGLPGMEIVTSVAVARNVGTQFEVRYVAGEYRLRIREGGVVIDHDGASIEAAAGEQLMIPGDGEVLRSTTELTGGDWAWTESVAEAPMIDNRPLAELLRWVGRETGREIRYESAEVRARSHVTILHGSIAWLAPMDALDTMLAATDFRYRILEDGSIYISARK